ncbi:MAG: hypothetical protein ACTHOR_14545 [Devosia sp.]
MLRLIKTSAALLTALALALLVAGCMITSEKPLLADAEGATPLPASFAFFPYERDGDGYLRSKDPPATFTLKGNHYLAAGLPDMKASLDIRFVPIGDDAYLLAATEGEEPGVIYGFARYADDVLSVELTPTEKTTEALEEARKGATPRVRRALQELTISQETDGITLASRAALDALVEMYLGGRLPMSQPAVAYIAPDTSTTPPARLAADGRHWTSVP